MSEAKKLVSILTLNLAPPVYMKSTHAFKHSKSASRPLSLRTSTPPELLLLLLMVVGVAVVSVVAVAVEAAVVLMRRRK